MSQITFVDIDTDVWNAVLDSLVKDFWTITYRYDNFDAGIDADFIILKKEDDEILFDWDNWFEGKIKFNEKYLEFIQSVTDYDFKKGDDDSIKPGVIELNRKWQAENLWGNSIL